MTSRRDALRAAAAAALLAGCERPAWMMRPQWLPTDIERPGRALGHWLRTLPRDLVADGGTLDTDIVIIGGGIAGLAAAWTLARNGHRRFVHLTGPEPFGNAAARHWQGVPCPQGAHYLPLPASECGHVRELLAEMGVLRPGADAARPHYDERAIVHAPDERLLIDGRWHDGLVPPPRDDIERAQQQRFFARMEELKRLRGSDGRRVFALPLALASTDATWRGVDRQTFAQWLDAEGYTAPRLRWYLDYACRDDYGAGAAQVSAFAGLHYFAARDGEAANADSHAVLTWPDGLNPLARHMAAAAADRQHAGLALRVRPLRHGVEVLVGSGPGQRVQLVRARRAILATPLHVVRHLLPAGFAPALVPEALPAHSSWLVGNLGLHTFPHETGEVPLAWDNVIYGSAHLGFVVATHQWLRVAKPEFTVFTTYSALPFAPGDDTRRWLDAADDATLRDMACADLVNAYGDALWRRAAHLHVTVRGHAMAVPIPGYLDTAARLGLDGDTGPIVFAHSDLSGYSVFEEAAWWGVEAARRCA